MSMKITTEIEWYGPDMVPCSDNCDVLCAIRQGSGRRVVAANWSAHSGHFAMMTGSSWRRLEPVRWAYMPDFPEDP